MLGIGWSVAVTSTAATYRKKSVFKKGRLQCGCADRWKDEGRGTEMEKGAAAFIL